MTAISRLRLPDVNPVTGCVWVVTDERPHGSDEELGLSLDGVFSSFANACMYLRGGAIEPEDFDSLEWYQSPRNPGFIEAYGGRKNWHFAITLNEIR